MKIGLFDSGVGGLSVLKSLLEHRFFEEIIYYGDTARVPYGIKDKNTIIRYSLEAVEFFKNFEIDILITACNSVSAYAIEEMRKVAPFKVYGVIEPGVLALNNALKNPEAEILVLGTKATINSKKYEKFLEQKGYCNLTALSPSLLVPIVEEGLFEGEVLQSTLNHYFNGIKEPDGIILGCTHFPLVQKALQEYFPNSLLIHSGEAIVEYLSEHFTLEQLYGKAKVKLFASESPENLKEVAKLWLNTKI